MNIPNWTTMDLEILYCIHRFPDNWLDKWLDLKNLRTWGDFEQKQQPGESFKEYRMRMDEVSRKYYEFKKRLYENR
jgi:hypothetical protein